MSLISAHGLGGVLWIDGKCISVSLFVFFRAVSTSTTYRVPAGREEIWPSSEVDGLDLGVCVSFFACRGCDEEARRRGPEGVLRGLVSD